MYEATGVVKHIDVTAKADAATVIAAVTGKKIRIISGSLSLSAAGTVLFKSASTALTGALALPANTPHALPFTPSGHFDTASGELLGITVAGGGNLNGWLTYQEIN